MLMKTGYPALRRWSLYSEKQNRIEFMLPVCYYAVFRKKILVNKIHTLYYLNSLDTCFWAPSLCLCRQFDNLPGQRGQQIWNIGTHSLNEHSQYGSGSRTANECRSMRIRIRNTGRTSAMIKEPVAKAQAELWSKLRSTEKTLDVEATELTFT